MSKSLVDWAGTKKYGYVQLGTFFLDHVQQLKISDGELVLIVQILRYSWEGKLPFPGVSTLAKKIGKTTRTVQLRMHALRDKKLVKVVSRPGTSNVYDFEPMFDQLRALVLECKCSTCTKRYRPLKDSSPPPLKDSSSDQDQKKKTKAKNLAGASEGSAADFSSLRARGEGGRVAETHPVTKTPSAGARELEKLVAEGNRRARETAKRRQPAKTKPDPQKQKERRWQDFSSKNPNDYNTNDLELVFADAYHERGWGTTPSFAGKERKLGKTLLEHYGGEATDKVIRDLVANWETYVAEFKLQGHPSMGLLFGWRNTFFPRVLEGPSKRAKPSWGAHFDEEDERGEDEDVVGW